MSTTENPAGGITLGSGNFEYRVSDGWAKLPPGWELRNVAGVAVDRDDRVYAFNRGPHPIIVFDPDGNVLGSWGEGIFTRPHGAHIGFDGMIYLTDDGDHSVRKFTLDGKLLLTIGIPGQAAPALSLKPFNRCTHSALSPEGDIYVTDGYGNARVHKYSPEGKYLMSWGDFGVDPGQFYIPHNVCCDDQGLVYVADRENHRIQVFDGNGKYQSQWNFLHRPCALCTDGARNPLFYIGELGPEIGPNPGAPSWPEGRRWTNRFDYPNLGPRVSIATRDGKIVARVGGIHPGNSIGEFVAPHGIAVDSRGDIYVAETADAAWSHVFPETAVPKDLRNFRKLVRVAA